MYEKIMIPVDLAHVDKLGKALATAAGLAKSYGIPLVYAGITSSTPSTLAHSPSEFADRLAAFAAAEGARHGITVEAHPHAIPDPSADLDKALLKAVTQIGADLVVMGSHIPNLADHIWPSHGGWLAAHAPVSVFIVRG